jgi:hypothetical protein
MLGGFINGVSGFAMNMHKYNQVTPVTTPTYYNPTTYNMGSVGDG